jgi:hypothetical protein
MALRRSPGGRCCHLCASTLPMAAVAEAIRSFLCFQLPVGLQFTAAFCVRRLVGTNLQSAR